MNPLIQLRKTIPLFVVASGLTCFALSPSMVTGTLPAFFRPEVQPNASYRALTFAERVSYQRVIEDVYWRHQIWPKERPDPKPSLDAVMSQAQLEKKVKDYLRNSQALEDYWQRPITAEQLQAEMERMAQHTKQPEVLRELFDALGNDPFVIAECLARPVLTGRLIPDLPAQDRIRRFESARTKGLSSMSMGATSARVAYTLPKISEGDPPCNDDTWTATSTANAPSARAGHTAVWTGSEMIVWGGNAPGAVYFNTGGRYNPSTDSWTATSTSNTPSTRAGHKAVWTGSEMIVWGGSNAIEGLLNTGGRYNPTANSWTATSVTSVPDARLEHTAVWTGSEMIVWGGSDGFNAFNTGGRYNPSTDSWIATSTANAPLARYLHAAVWTGSEMIVWGGYDVTYSDAGGRYNPSTDSWTATNTANAPTGRFYHTAVWSGSEMIVWGGQDGSGLLNSGGKYNPGTDSWTASSTANAPDARLSHTVVWTSTEMIVWGGAMASPPYDSDTGARYNPAADSWTATSTTDAPTGRSDHTAIWTGSEMIVWGGFCCGQPPIPFNTGGKYCVQSGPRATPTPRPRPSPHPRP